MPPASSPSLPHFKLLAHTSSILTLVPHCLTQHTASHLTQSRSVSRTRMVVAPFTASLSLSRHSRSHQILQSSAYVFPSDDLCNLASAAHVVTVRMSLGDIDTGIGYERIEIGIYWFCFLFVICDLCFFFSKKYVLTEKSKKKNKLICVSIYVYVWDCDLYFLFFFYGEKFVLTKKRERERKKIFHYGIMHILILKILHKLIWCKNFFFFSLHILSWLGLFLASGP